MNLSSQLFPAVWLWITALPAALLLGRAVRIAPWQRLRDPVRLNSWFGFIVVLSLLWTMNASVREGLNLHLLGATVATLMFGWSLALPAMALVLLISAINGEMDFSTLGLNLLVMACLPILLAHRLRRFAERRLPPNYFVYIFVQAFAGAALGVVLVGFAATAVLALGGAYELRLLLEEYLPFFMLLAFSEAWMSGMAMTLMVVFRPEWVGSFDDKRYLARRPGTGRNDDGQGKRTGEKRE